MPGNIAIASKESNIKYTTNFAYLFLFLILQLSVVFAIVYGYYLLLVIFFLCLMTIFIINNIEKSLYLVLLSFAFSQSIPLFTVSNRVVGISSDFILMPIVILSWLLKKLYQENTNRIRYRNELVRPILFFMTSAVISILFASTKLSLPQLLDGILWIMGLAEYIFISFIVADLVKTEKQVKSLLYFMFFLAAIVALVGILQGLVYGITPIGSVFGSIFRGRSGNHNVLGSYMGIFAILGFSLAMYYRGHKRLIFLLLVCLFIWTMILTLSRSSWLGLILALAFLLFQLRKKSLLLGAIIFSLCLSLMIPNRVKERASSIFQALFDKEVIETFTKTNFSRLQQEIVPIVVKGYGHDSDIVSAGLRYAIWKETFDTFKRFPITGTGYALNKYFSRASTADNLFLDILVWVGIPGFLIFIWLCLKIVKMARNTYDKLPTGFYKTVTLGYRSSLVLILIISLTGSVISNFKLSSLFWPLTGLIVSIRNHMDS